MDLLDVQEPFQALFTQGMILGADGNKMSSSKGNVVAPSEIVERFGADAARCYVLFIGPPEQDAAWSDSGVEGVHRFLNRLWRLGRRARRRPTSPPARAAAAADARRATRSTLVRKANWAIEKVTGDIRGRFAFNTAIAAVMELVNEIYRHPEADREARRFAIATAASLVFPFAPHLGSEVYERLTGERVWEQPWPDADPDMLTADTFELVCMVNGKVRDRVTAPDRRPAGGARAPGAGQPRGVQAHVNGHAGRQGDRRARQAGQRRRPLRRVAAGAVLRGRDRRLRRHRRAGTGGRGGGPAAGPGRRDRHHRRRRRGDGRRQPGRRRGRRHGGRHPARRGSQRRQPVGDDRPADRPGRAAQRPDRARRRLRDRGRRGLRHAVGDRAGAGRRGSRDRPRHLGHRRRAGGRSPAGGGAPGAGAARAGARGAAPA